MAHKLIRRYDARGLTQGALAVMCVALLGSAIATEYIGIHAIFGASCWARSCRPIRASRAS